MPRISPRPSIVRGLPRECTCTPSRGHGDQHTYDLHGCGCEDCLTASRRYAKLGRALSATGRTRRRAADPIRRRLELLKERGYTIAEIADHSGVSFTNLHQVLRSGQPTVTERVHAAVMAVPVPPRHQREVA